MINVNLIKDLCKGTHVVTSSKAQVAMDIVSSAPFEDITCRISCSTEDRKETGESDLIVDQINILLWKLKSFLIEKPELKACFSSWFALEDEKNSSMSIRLINDKKRKLSPDANDENDIPPVSKFRTAFESGEISKQMAAERKSVFDYLRNYADAIIAVPTALPPNIPRALSDFKKNFRPMQKTNIGGSTVKIPLTLTTIDLKVRNKSFPSTSSIKHSSKKCSSSTEFLPKLSFMSPRRKKNVLHNGSFISPLKNPLTPKRNDVVARNLIKKSSNYRKPEKIKHRRVAVRSDSVDEMVEKKMQEKRPNLLIACQMACKMVCESNVIEDARAKGEYHPMTEYGYREMLWRRKIKNVCSKQVIIYKFDEEREYLKNLTAKISKSARQNGAVEFPSSSESNDQPRFPLNVRKPFRQYNRTFEDDRKKITSDGDIFNTNVFATALHRKMRDTFYDTEIEMKRYNFDDRYMEAYNVEAVFLFQQNSPFGDVANIRRDLFCRRTISCANNIYQPKKLVGEIKNVYEERGIYPRQMHTYTYLVETVPNAAIPSDSASNSSSGSSVTPPPSLVFEPPPYFLPSTNSQNDGQESPSEILPEEFLTIQLAPDHQTMNESLFNFFPQPVKRQPLLIAPYCASPFPSVPMR